MKNNMKIILGFCIGVLCSGITVYAATTYLSNEVKFTPSNESWEVTNVEEALNDLYENGGTKMEPMTIGFRPGSNNSSFTRFDLRIELFQYKPYYKYFKIVKAEPITSCTSIYFNSSADQATGNIYINQQYNIAEYNTLFSYVTGSKGCFYDLDIQLYN